MKLMDKAQNDMSNALQAQKEQLEDAMQDMSWPKEWDLDEEGRPTGGLLIPLSPTSDEYWHVFERLRAPSNPAHQTATSGKEGLADAWISSISRIQNTSLYTYYHFQRDRMLMAMTGIEQAQVGSGGNWREGSDLAEKAVWHGTIPPAFS